MAIVTGTIRGSDNVTGSWVLTFIPQETPTVVSSSVIGAGLDKKIATDSVGAFSVELLEGRYTVELGNGEEFEIDVGGAGPYSIGDLIIAAGESGANAYRASGHGTPEGSRRGDPGWTYLDVDTGDFYVKRSGTGTTGWEQRV